MSGHIQGGAMLCGHCSRPIIGGAAFVGGVAYHLECVRSPYAAPLPPESELRAIVRDELRAELRKLGVTLPDNFDTARG